MLFKRANVSFGTQERYRQNFAESTAQKKQLTATNCYKDSNFLENRTHRLPKNDMLVRVQGILGRRGVREPNKSMSTGVPGDPVPDDDSTNNGAVSAEVLPQRVLIDLSEESSNEDLGLLGFHGARNAGWNRRSIGLMVKP